jgi:CubicO group peptidase (beta-lactamase class C family)
MILLRSFPKRVSVRRTAAVIAVSLLALIGQRSSAQGFFQNPFQNLTFSLFERYLEALRLQAGIPGMSALILRDGVIVWERGFGRADLERAVDATPTTPYPIGGLSQAIGATLLLKVCVEEGFDTVNDRIGIWSPFAAEADSTVRQLLGHVSSTGAYKYDLARVAAVTPAIEACSGTPYEQTVAEQVFLRLGMTESVPATALGAPTLDDMRQFGLMNLNRYAVTLGRTAKPYRVEARGRATRTDPAPSHANAATGLVSTVRDLARFDIGLRLNVLLRPDTQLQAWSPVGFGFPTGLGWFVQVYNGIPVVWQFGVIPDAYSSLVLKVPTRGLTLILLANSDGLSAQQSLEKGDVTASVFARTFLRVYVP